MPDIRTNLNRIITVEPFKNNKPNLWLKVFGLTHNPTISVDKDTGFQGIMCRLSADEARDLATMLNFYAEGLHQS